MARKGLINRKTKQPTNQLNNTLQLGKLVKDVGDQCSQIQKITNVFKSYTKKSFASDWLF